MKPKVAVTKHDLRNLFTDPQFQFVDADEVEWVGLAPHRVLHSKQDGGIVVLLLELQPGEDDYRIYEKPLEVVCQRLAEGVVAAAYLVQCRQDLDGSFEFIAAADAVEVSRNIKRKLGH
jgi:hypothetical protein